MAFSNTGTKTGGNASRPANQLAIAASYAAEVANAVAASRRRVSCETSPASRSSPSTSS